LYYYTYTIADAIATNIQEKFQDKISKIEQELNDIREERAKQEQGSNNLPSVASSRIQCEGYYCVLEILSKRVSKFDDTKYLCTQEFPDIVSEEEVILTLALTLTPNLNPNPQAMQRDTLHRKSMSLNSTGAISSELPSDRLSFGAHRTSSLLQFGAKFGTSAGSLKRQSSMQEKVEQEITSNPRLAAIVEEQNINIDEILDDEEWEKYEEKGIERYYELEEDKAVCCGAGDDDDDDMLTADEAIVCVERVFERLGSFIMSIFPYLRRKIRQCQQVCVD
jgi:hypothetical protein